MELLVFVVLLVVLDYAALRWGHDSRDGFAGLTRRRGGRF